MNEKKQSSLSDKDLVRLRLMGVIGKRTLDEYTDNKYSFVGETLHAKSDEEADDLADIIVRNA